MKNITILFCFCFTLAHSQTWQWTKQAGGTNNDNGRAICTDGTGDFYVAGDSAEFAEIDKYNFWGNSIWSINAWTGSAKAITLDHSGNLYVVGDSSNYIKIGKYDNAGNKLWQLTGGYGNANGISIDNAGNIYTTGSDHISKYDLSGNLLWNKTIAIIGNSIVADTSGNSYTTGYFSGSASFGANTLTALGTQDIFITKYDPAGNCLWAKRAGGKFTCCYSHDAGNAITIDNMGNAYLTGSFVDTSDFDSFVLIGHANDIFVAKYSPAGNAVWVEQATGGSDQEGRAIALDNNGNVLIGGSYVPSVDFSGYSLSGWGNYDAFIAEYDNNGSFITAMKAGEPTWNDYIYGICTDASGNTFFAGSFSSTAYFGSDTLVSNGGYDMCIGKIDLQTGIEENQIDLINLNIYPNPTIGQITIEFNLTDTKQTIVEIKNVLGQTLNTIDSGFSIGKNQLEINTSEYSQGIYFIQLQNGNKLLSKKIVKQ